MVCFILCIYLREECVLQIEVEFLENISAGFDIILLEIWYLTIGGNILNNTAGRSCMTDTVDQDQLAECLVGFELVNDNLLCKFQMANGNLIFLNMVCLNMLSAVDIDLVLNAL